MLLFRHHLPAPWAREGWLTPGGAIDTGEAPAQAAVRELAEETGQRLTVPQIGNPVATDCGQWQQSSGTVVTTTNWYFFGRAQTARIDLTGQDEDERRDLLGFRWWDSSELAATDELVFPVGLADLLSRLIAGDLPHKPIRLPWT